jgi:hypothetical protein
MIYRNDELSGLYAARDDLDDLKNDNSAMKKELEFADYKNKKIMNELKVPTHLILHYQIPKY